MKKEDAEEFTQSLGQVVGGAWRQIALAKRLGVPKALELTTEQWVNTRLGGYVKLAVEDRRKAVEELVEQGESTREIASVLGVDQSTVVRDANASKEVSESGRSDLPVDANASTQEMASDHVQLAESKPEEELDPQDGDVAIKAPVDAVAALAIDEKSRKDESKTADNHRAKGTGDNEWYTPTKYIETARSVLGEIDVDPASNDTAQEWIKASSYFTKEQNGLKRKWKGRVWLNPPYEQPYIQQFAEKMVQEVEAGRVTEAIMLTHNYTDTAWFHLLANAAQAICFTRGRIRFVNVEGDEASPTQGQAFFYFGDRATVFAKAFREIGFVR